MTTGSLQINGPGNGAEGHKSSSMCGSIAAVNCPQQQNAAAVDMGSTSDDMETRSGSLKSFMKVFGEYGIIILITRTAFLP